MVFASEKDANKDKDEKSKIEKELFSDRKNAWEMLGEERKTAFRFCDDYKEFIDKNKTEREITAWAERLAKKNGYVSFEEATPTSKKIYSTNHGKNIVLVDLGNGKLSDGLRIIGAHIDSLRLDLKLNPVYESDPFLMINLHYYGGIKKFQWLNVPLAMHGVVFNKKGEKVNIEIGEKDDEPVFVISDLAIHLEEPEFKEKPTKDIIKGEDLDAIGGSIPLDDKKVKEKLKAAFLKAINDKYKLVEEDFVSAEVSLYPATKARDVGIDSGIIGAPAHDDRVCAYLSIQSIMEAKSTHPKMVLFVDKEETGSVGNTSMDSMFLENFIEKLVKLRKETHLAKEVLAKSKAISADVTHGLDPKFADKMDLSNVNKVGYGTVVEKYGGGGGKYYTNDANAEYLSWIRRVFDEANIPWQHGEASKVDQGGGGTISYMLAKYNMDIIDIGPPVLAMHSPFELTSKIDVYATFKAYKAFYEYK
ncbi:MAG: aminopeptidase [Candidatus Diapherotrites archaeon]|nr:aminopeptidase [Candidatus Diapherotrites archaeon]